MTESYHKIKVPASMFRSSHIFTKLHIATFTPSTYRTFRSFSSRTAFRMPEALKQSEIDKGQDPTVQKQWDNDTPLDQRYEDFAAIADKLGIGMMGTLREGIGVQFSCDNLLT